MTNASLVFMLNPGRKYLESKPLTSYLAERQQLNKTEKHQWFVFAYWNIFKNMKHNPNLPWWQINWSKELLSIRAKSNFISTGLKLVQYSVNGASEDRTFLRALAHFIATKYFIKAIWNGLFVSIYCDINTLEVVEHSRSERNNQLYKTLYIRKLKVKLGIKFNFKGGSNLYSMVLIWKIIAIDYGLLIPLLTESFSHYVSYSNVLTPLRVPR
jgi:hypothetical protein